MDTNVDAPAASDTAPGALVPIQPGLGFEMSVRMWGDSAILVLETTTEEDERIAVRDAAVRVAAMAEAAGAGGLCRVGQRDPPAGDPPDRQV